MRVPPHSLPDERVVIATALVAPVDAEPSVVDLRDDDFFAPVHREIWASLRALVKGGQLVDVRALSEDLHRRKVDADAEVGALIDEACHPDILGRYVARVREKATARRLIALCAEVTSMTYDSADLDATIGHARAQLGDLESGAGVGATPIADVLPDVLAAIEYRHRSPHEFAVQTGLRAFDILTGGMRPGKLIVVGGLPGMGKTAWAVNVCGYAASRGVPTLVVSLEMSRDELAERWISREARIPAVSISTGAVAGDRQAMASVFRAGGEIGEWPLWVDDKSRTLARIAGSIRRWWAREIYRKGHKIGLVAIDYLTLIKPEERAETRALEVGEMSRTFKLLAGELGLPIVLLSQLNRLAARENRRPIESDLRDSGAVEQDADMIVFPWREFPKDANGNALVNESGPAEWIVGKNRHGPKGLAKAHWHAPTMGFYDIEEWSAGR